MNHDVNDTHCHFSIKSNVYAIGYISLGTAGSNCECRSNGGPNDCNELQ